MIENELDRIDILCEVVPPSQVQPPAPSSQVQPPADMPPAAPAGGGGGTEYTQDAAHADPATAATWLMARDDALSPAHAGTAEAADRSATSSPFALRDSRAKTCDGIDRPAPSSSTCPNSP